MDTDILLRAGRGAPNMLKIRDQRAKYHKLVFEVRYDRGFLYLDRCGATANRIMATDPAWVIRGENVSPQGAPLVHAVTGTQLNFGVYKYDFSVDQPVGQEAALTQADVTAFITQVASIGPILHEELTLTTLRRKGFRVFYVFPFTSEDESHDWLRTLSAVTVSPTVSREFEAELEKQSHVLVLKSADRKFRISISPVERRETLDLGSDVLRTLPRSLPQGQREAVIAQARARNRILANAEFAVMIDVDVFIDDPIEVDAQAFLTESLKLVETRLPAALR